MKMKLKVVIYRHYIEGDEINVLFNIGGNGPNGQDTGLPFAVQKRTQDLPKIYESLDSIQNALRNLGNEVEIVTKIYDDPNFESEEQAADCLENE